MSHNPYDRYNRSGLGPNSRGGDRIHERRRIADQTRRDDKRERGENPFDNSKGYYEHYNTPTLADGQMQYDIRNAKELLGSALASAPALERAVEGLQSMLGRLASDMAGVVAPDTAAVDSTTAAGKQAMERGVEQLGYASSETPLVPEAQRIIADTEEIQAASSGADGADKLVALRGQGEGIIGQLQGMLTHVDSELRAIHTELEAIVNEVR